MSGREPLNGAEREFEAALGRLRPAQAVLDRDELLFHAGRASVRRRCLVWQSASGVLASALVVVALWPHNVPSAQRAASMATDMAGPGMVAAEPAPAARGLDAPQRWRFSRALDSPYSYHTLRDAVLAHGVSALPKAQGGAGGADRWERELAESLRLRRGSRLHVAWPLLGGDG